MSAVAWCFIVHGAKKVGYISDFACVNHNVYLLCVNGAQIPCD